jgi:hypothetical protein
VRNRSRCQAARKERNTVTFSARQEAIALITVGVDTHLDMHVAVALDQLGRRLDILSLPTTKTGYERLVSWAESFEANWCG